MAFHSTSPHTDSYTKAQSGLLLQQTAQEPSTDGDLAISLGLPLKCRVTQEGFIIDAEQDFLQFFGLGKHLKEKTALAEALKSPDAELLLGYLSQAENWGEARFELQVTGTEGDVRWLECSVRKDRSQNMTQVTVRDISLVIDHLENFSAHRQRYDDTSYLLRIHEVGETLAHELNQPLAAISNYCTGAIRRLRGKAENIGEICDSLEKAVSQITRASEVIEQLRSTLKRPALNVGRYSLANLVSDSLAILVADAKRRGAVFLVNLQPHLPDVQVDAVLIRQLLTKFVHASLDMMQGWLPPTAVCLSARLGSGRNFGSIEVSVSIEPPANCSTPLMADQKDILHNASQSFPEIEICQSIIELHRGRLWIEISEEGKNTFYFTLPATTLSRDPRHADLSHR